MCTWRPCRGRPQRRWRPRPWPKQTSCCCAGSRRAWWRRRTRRAGRPASPFSRASAAAALAGPLQTWGSTDTWLRRVAPCMWADADEQRLGRSASGSSRGKQAPCRPHPGPSIACCCLSPLLVLPPSLPLKQKAEEQADGSSNRSVQERSDTFASWEAAISCSLAGARIKRLSKLYLALRGACCVGWGGGGGCGSVDQACAC